MVDVAFKCAIEFSAMSVHAVWTMHTETVPRSHENENIRYSPTEIRYFNRRYFEIFVRNSSFAHEE